MTVQIDSKKEQNSFTMIKDFFNTGIIHDPKHDITT